MKNNLPAASVRKSFVYLLLLLVITLGTGALLRMDMRLLPEQSLPTYTIQAAAPGLAAEVMVERVTKPLEEAIQEVGEVEKITSRTETGAAYITLKVKEHYSSDYQERLDEKLAEVAKRLPGGADSIQVEKDHTGDNELAYYLLHGSDLQTLSDVGKYTVSEKLSNLPGVSRVVIENEGVANKVEVQLRPSMLQAYSLTPQEIVSHLRRGPDQEQLGTVGDGGDSTGLVWVQQAASLQELGRTLIPTQRGYVALSLLADIRDLRGSEGESSIVYKGDPAVAIRIFGQETGQTPDTRQELSQAVASLNEEGKGRYQLALVKDHVVRLTDAMLDGGYFLLIAALLSSSFIGYRLRSVRAALLALVTVASAIGILLSAAWLSGSSINIATLAPIAVWALYFMGAGMILCNSFAGAKDRTQETIDALTKKHLPAMLLAALMLVLLFLPLLYTDFLKPTDKPTLFEGLPIFLWGILALLLSYGLIMPTLAPLFLKGSRPVPVAGKNDAGKLIGWLDKRFRKWVGQKYVPYFLTLIISLGTVELLHTFVLTDPFLKTETNQMSLSLEMVKGSRVSDAIQAAKQAEAKLAKIGEIHSFYTVASEDQLTFTITLIDKYDWMLSRTKLEEELEKALRDIPGTDPFALVVGEDRGSRLEFTVKGPSFHTTNEIANQMLKFLSGLAWRDDEGKEIITDEWLGEDDGRTYIEIQPKKEMLARYQISAEQVKEQLSSYLGEQSGGSLYWNNASVPFVVRYPEKLLEHADQAKQLLIRTTKGTVRLRDLVDWQIGNAPTVVEREDGLYVMKVSSAISDPNRIDSLYYFLPDRMKETVTFPEGYLIQTGEELRKLKEEESEKTDVGSRIFAVSLAVLSVLVASLAIVRRIADGLITMLLLPTLAGAVLLGLLISNRPLNIMGFYGAVAATALLAQQALSFLNHLQQAREHGESIEKGVLAAAKEYLPVMGALLVTILTAAMPLSFGWGTGLDFHASFATALVGGILLAGWAVMVLLPGMYQASELAKLKRAGNETDYAQLFRVWWANYRVRKMDLREWKEQNMGVKEKPQEKGQPGKRKEELSSEDFLPL